MGVTLISVIFSLPYCCISFLMMFGMSCSLIGFALALLLVVTASPKMVVLLKNVCLCPLHVNTRITFLIIK